MTSGTLQLAHPQLILQQAMLLVPWNWTTHGMSSERRLRSCSSWASSGGAISSDNSATTKPRSPVVAAQMLLCHWCVSSQDDDLVAPPPPAAVALPSGSAALHWQREHASIELMFE